MNTSKSWDYITKTAATPEGMNREQFVLFHMFNPNGVMARKEACDQKVRELVELKRVRPGALLAYGSFNDYNTKILRREANRKVKNSWRILQSEIRMIEYDIEHANEFIRENS